MAETGSETAPPPEPVADWRAALPDDLKAEKSLESFKGKDWSEVGPIITKAFVDTKRLVGNAVKTPKDDAPAEEWEKFYTALGRPETAEKYGTKMPEFPEELGVSLDQEAFQAFLKEAHGAGLTQKQVQKVMDWYGQYTLGAADKHTQAQAVQRTTAEAALKKNWGPAYQRNVNLAKQAVRDLFSDNMALAEAIEHAGNNVDLVKGLVRIGERMMEHGEITGEFPPGESVEDMQKVVVKLRTELEDFMSEAQKSEKTDQYLAAIRRLQKAGGAIPTTG